MAKKPLARFRHVFGTCLQFVSKNPDSSTRPYITTIRQSGIQNGSKSGQQYVHGVVGLDTTHSSEFRRQLFCRIKNDELQKLCRIDFRKDKRFLPEATLSSLLAIRIVAGGDPISTMAQPIAILAKFVHFRANWRLLRWYPKLSGLDKALC